MMGTVASCAAAHPLVASTDDPEAARMDVLVAPDSFGGTLIAREVADAFAGGWRETRPGDAVRTLPLSDGGEGLIDVLQALVPEARLEHVEVAGTDTRPVLAPVLWLDARTAVLESAAICGLPPSDVARRPLEASSYGVGQALTRVVAAGARHVVLGLGGTGVVDGGSGALNGLGMRLRVADGSGLRVGAGDLAACTSVERGWWDWPEPVTLDLLADTRVTLEDAVSHYGPQKGVAPAQVGPLTDALRTWARVLGAAFPGTVAPDSVHTGAAGGLGFALAVALGGRLTSGAAWVGERVGLATAVADADLVVSGEGRLDGTSSTGKVVGHVLDAARAQGRAVAVVAGRVEPGALEALGLARDRVVTAPASGPGPAARSAVHAAARTLAARIASVHSSSS
jgi:glycerate 2-kinase